MDTPQVNIPLLRKAVEWVESEAAKPEYLSQWNQDSWIVEPTQVGRAPECGTCYCVAGFVVAQTHRVTTDNEMGYIIDGDLTLDTCCVAMEELGLNHTQAGDLFYGANTVQDIRRHAEKIAGERL